MATPRLHRRAAQLAMLVCFAVDVAGLAPGSYWLDSSELAAGAFELGVAHPPGHPLAMLIGKLFTLIPVGAVAFRAGLAQAVCGALAAGLTALCAAEIARRTLVAVSREGAGDEPIEAALGCGAGLAFGLSYAAAFQAVRPEVYALHAALVLAATFSLLRFDAAGDRRWLYLAALALGLALANHHFLAFTFVGAALLFLGSYATKKRERIARGAIFLLAAGALGLIVYLYLPFRAAAHPEVDWGAPTTWPRFFWTVSARAFQKSLAHHGEASTSVAFALVGELGVSAALALLGSYLLLRLRDTRRAGILLVAAVALDAAAPALVGFDSANPDAYGYLEPAVALLACLGAAAPAAMLGLVKKKSVARGTSLALAFCMAAFPALSLPLSLRTHFSDTDEFAAALLDGAPPRAALFTSNFQSVFALWYRRGVEGRRPDVAHLHRHFLSYPGYRDEAVRRFPDLAPFLGEHDAIALPRLAEKRPVLLEYDLDLDEQLVPLLSPGAAIDQLSASPLRDLPAAPLDPRLAALDTHEPQTQRALLWLDFQQAHRDCRAGRPRAAADEIARARALLDGATDPDLEELATRCVH
jgi:hypothetical protein